MERAHIGLDNWFLVIPAAILGVAALLTVNSMYRAGDIRRSIEVVTTYQVEGKPMLGDFLESRVGAVACEAELLSTFYGTLDVSCAGAGAADAPRYSWRVHVGQRSFAPSDDVTFGLMREYAPSVFKQEKRE